MKVDALDHVALWSAEREALAQFLIARLGMHVIEQTEKFTLVGVNARRGKLTLFDAEGPRDVGSLARIELEVKGAERRGRALSQGVSTPTIERTASRLAGPEGLPLGLVESDLDRGDIASVALRVRDPERAFGELAQLGFQANGGTLRAGSTEIELLPGGQGEPGRPLLNHLGLLVDSAGEHLEEARSRGLEIADVVDGPNTYAVFVWGPDRIKLEYVEHKESFSLV